MQILNVLSTPAISNPSLNPTEKPQQTNFSELLFNAIEKVNMDLHNSQTISNQFLVGEIDNIHDVRIAGMKADLSFSTTIEVNNKLLSAYNEILRLQL